MVWGCFSEQWIGAIHTIDGIMNRFMYRGILKDVMFQQDNNPKHMSKVVKELFQHNLIEVLPQPAESHNLNPIENLWEIVNLKN